MIWKLRGEFQTKLEQNDALGEIPNHGHVSQLSLVCVCLCIVEISGNTNFVRMRCNRKAWLSTKHSSAMSWSESHHLGYLGGDGFPIAVEVVLPQPVFLLALLPRSHGKLDPCSITNRIICKGTQRMRGMERNSPLHRMLANCYIKSGIFLEVRKPNKNKMKSALFSADL